MCDEVAVLAHPPNMATSLSEVLTYENPHIGCGLSPVTLGLDHFPLNIQIINALYIAKKN